MVTREAVEEPQTGTVTRVVEEVELGATEVVVVTVADAVHAEVGAEDATTTTGAGSSDIFSFG